MNEKTKWIRCPVCGNKTRDKITVVGSVLFYIDFFINPFDGR